MFSLLLFKLIIILNKYNDIVDRVIKENIFYTLFSNE